MSLVTCVAVASRSAEADVKNPRSSYEPKLIYFGQNCKREMKEHLKSYLPPNGFRQFLDSSYLIFISEMYVCDLVTKGSM